MPYWLTGNVQVVTVARQLNAYKWYFRRDAEVHKEGRSAHSGKIVGFVPTADYDKARAFYENQLGFEFVSLDQYALVMNAGGDMKEHAGELGAIAHHWFKVMRKCGDEVRELLPDRYPIACLGDAPFD